MGASDRAEWLPIALDFDDVDIAANRSGVLSERQRERMARLRSHGRTGTVLVAVVVFALILMVGLLILPRLANNGGGTMAILAGALGLVVIVLAVALFSTRRALNRFTGGVLRVTGTARTRVRRSHAGVVDRGAPRFGHGSPRYELSIGERRFIVADLNVLEAFEEGDTYAGYYVGRGIMTRLLSAEAVNS